ncbi:hypothetical protein ACLIWK_006623, partial [Pseudomonas aeruginosa]
PSHFPFPQNLGFKMARHKQPDVVAKFKGADKKNPQRYRQESAKGEGEVGEAPIHLQGPALREGEKYLGGGARKIEI